MPFAGSPHRPRPSHEPVVEASPDAASPDADAAMLDVFSALSISCAAEDLLTALSEAGRIHHPPRRAPFREAGPVGVARAMRRPGDGTGDVLAPTFRAAGAMQLLGFDLDAFFRAHLRGEVTASRGLDLDLHHVDLERGILAPVVPLGLLVEVVGGLALGFRMRGQDRVAIVCDSDGATSTGAWHEGLVFAAARRAPMVLVVETGLDDAALRRQTRVRSFTEKAAGYGIASDSVDGADVLGVIDTVGAAIERARTGEGVQMVEIRYGGVDPVERLRQQILDRGHASAGDLDGSSRDAAAACAAAAERVAHETVPDIPERFGGIYTDSDPSARRTWAGPRITEVVER
jgi:TPP-dependent pyruvate/acetoin dehydrogenase alpha subunit